MEWQLSLADLALWPLTLPVRGFVLLIDQIRERADRELHDPHTLQQRLLELQMRYELGELSEGEYRGGWEQLTRQLMALGIERTLRD